MKPLPQLFAEVDDGLARVGLLRRSGPGELVARSYETHLDGMPLRATLSVLVDTGTVHRLTSGQATGYVLSVECQNGLATRWLVGASLPLLVGLGLPKLGPVSPGNELRADDEGWARSRLLAGPARGALEGLLAVGAVVEQRPGILEARLSRLGDTHVPDLARWMEAFASLVRLSQMPPNPRVAGARLTDNRGLMMALLSVVVVGVFLGCGVLYWAAVR